MNRRPRLTRAEIDAEVERLARCPRRAHGNRPVALPAYLANCVRSGVDPYSVSPATRARVAQAFARAHAAHDSAPGQAEGATQVQPDRACPRLKTGGTAIDPLRQERVDQRGS